MHLMGNEIDTWSSPPDTISTTGVNASNPHIGMDAAGNVVALWLEGDAVISKASVASGTVRVTRQPLHSKFHSAERAPKFGQVLLNCIAPPQ